MEVTHLAEVATVENQADLPGRWIVADSLAGVEPDGADHAATGDGEEDVGLTGGWRGVVHWTRDRRPLALVPVPRLLPAPTLPREIRAFLAIARQLLHVAHVLCLRRRSEAATHDSPSRGTALRFTLFVHY